MVFNQPFSNHNGGDINFREDGLLYIGTGDGGSGEDPQNHGQNRNSYLGKILRLDVSGTTGYTIPAGNPFVGENDVKEEIWSYGLRNPWRFSFDRMTGDMWIGDVGQYDWEEVDFESANAVGGLNYGWRCREGLHSGYGNDPCDDEYVDPIFEYFHDFNTGGYSITGGFVYRGSESPDLVGMYICADYVTGNFWIIKPDEIGSGWQNFRQNSLLTDVSTFGEDINGELFLGRLNDDKVYKLAAECGTSNLSLTISLVGDSIISDSDEDDIVWLFNEVPIEGEHESYIILQEEGEYQAVVTVVENCCTYIITSNTINFSQSFDCPDTMVDVSITMVDDSIYQSAGPSGTYVWLLNGNVVEGENNPFLLATEPGDYQLIITHEIYYNDGVDTCTYGDASNSVTYTIVGLSIESSRELQVYPNPTTDIIKADLPSSSILQIRLLDINGQELPFEYARNSNTIEIDLTQLPANTYFLEVITNAEKYIGKILKE